MNKRAFLFLFLLGVSLFVVYINGCGTTTSSDSTTTTTVPVSSSQLDAAKTGVLLASGGSTTGVAGASVGSAAGASPAVMRAIGLTAPPSTFFTVDLTTGTASIDGYIQPVAGTVLSGNVTPYVRLHTVGGDIVKGTFLAGKKIASLEGLTLETIIGTGPGTKPAGIDTAMSTFVGGFVTDHMTSVNPYNDSALFTPVVYLADYLGWAFIFPTMEAKATSLSGWQSYIHMTTPEAGASDKIASMEEKMVFSKTATGELIVSVSTEPDGRPTAGTYSGTGTLLIPTANLDTTIIMVFPTTGDPPGTLTVIGTMDAAPFYTVTVTVTPSTGVGTGTIKDSSGTVIGSIEAGPSGGKVIVGDSSETFTF